MKIDMTKKCSMCNVIKSLTSFDKRAGAKDGYRNKCKECRRKYFHTDEWRKYKQEYGKEYRRLNDKELKAKKKNYYEDNKDIISVKTKKYRENNKEIILEKKKIYCKEKVKTDPFFRLKKNISGYIYYMLKNNQGSKNGFSILEYLPYTIEELKIHIQNQFEYWMTWDNQGIYKPSQWDDNNSNTWKWQLDHIIPHSDLPYVSMSDDNFKKAWSLENLRPLSAKQNNFDGVNGIRHLNKLSLKTNKG